MPLSAADQYFASPSDPFIPNPAFPAPSFSSAGSGSWDTPATWVGGVAPAANDIVVIDPGHDVLIDSTAPICNSVVIDVGGKLTFSPTVNTELQAVNLMVLGELEVGSSAVPISSAVTATITFRDVAINTANDPAQYLNGLLSLGDDAKVCIYGKTLGNTFLRVATEPKAGDATFDLVGIPTGWAVGDRVIIPDTRWYSSSEQTDRNAGIAEWEERTITAINGMQITIDTALTHDHEGGYDQAGNLDFLPHVMNLTRNVRIRSENPLGTRGHTLFQGGSDVDVRYAAFQDLGRTLNIPLDVTTFDGLGNATHIGTNQIARYAIHTHHLTGATEQANGYQFTLLGNAVDQGTAEHNHKWAIAIHASHYGLIQGNTCYNIPGAAILTEDGTESYNVFDGNCVIRSYSVNSGWRFSDERGFGMTAREASGFWFRGPHNYCRNNVAANIHADNVDTAYGYKFMSRYVGFRNTPEVQGQSTAVNATVADLNESPILQFENNEVYGGTGNGLTYWWIGAFGSQVRSNAQRTTIKDFKVWNCYGRGIFHYPATKITIDGMIVRGQDHLKSRSSTGISTADYVTSDMIVKNCDFQGINTGIQCPDFCHGDFLIEDSYIHSTVHNVHVNTHFSVHGANNHPPKSVTLRNVTHGYADSRSFVTTQGIRVANGEGVARNVIQDNDVFVEDHDGVAGDSFRIFSTNQDPNMIMPQTGSKNRLLASPVAGLTNQENFDMFGIAWSGSLAPTDHAVARIDGYVAGQIIGVATNGGAPVFSATVTATDTVTSETYTDTTDVNGNFAVAVPAGTFNITAQSGVLTGTNAGVVVAHVNVTSDIVVA